HVDSRAPEERVDGARREAGEQLSFRIGPEILLGARDVYGARREQRQERVLVERERVLTIRVGVEVLAEPVWEARRDVRDPFAEATARELRARASGAACDGEREAFVASGGPERGLAETRMADHRDARRVDFRKLLERVEDAR